MSLHQSSPAPYTNRPGGRGHPCSRGRRKTHQCLQELHQSCWRRVSESPSRVSESQSQNRKKLPWESHRLSSCRVVFTKRCHYDYYCHYCHHNYRQNLIFFSFVTRDCRDCVSLHSKQTNGICFQLHVMLSSWMWLVYQKAQHYLVWFNKCWYRYSICE